jgi:hypothetical protein
MFGARDDQRKKSSARSCSQTGPASFSAGQHMGSVCGHSFIVGCMWRGAAHESSFSVGCGPAHGSACGLAQRGVHAARGACACVVTRERRTDTEKERKARILYSIELRMFHAFRFMFHLDVVCVFIRILYVFYLDVACCKGYTRMLKVYVSNVSSVLDVCYKCFIWMLHMAIYICCKHLFIMLHLFQTYIASVLSECCSCYIHMLQACFTCFRHTLH